MRLVLARQFAVRNVTCPFDLREIPRKRGRAGLVPLWICLNSARLPNRQYLAGHLKTECAHVLKFFGNKRLARDADHGRKTELLVAQAETFRCLAAVFAGGDAFDVEEASVEVGNVVEPDFITNAGDQQVRLH